MGCHGDQGAPCFTSFKRPVLRTRVCGTSAAGASGDKSVQQAGGHANACCRFMLSQGPEGGGQEAAAAAARAMEVDTSPGK